METRISFTSVSETKWVKDWYGDSDRRVTAGTFPAYRYSRPSLSMSPSPIDCICATSVVLVTEPRRPKELEKLYRQ
jgi:hypothetical protein